MSYEATVGSDGRITVPEDVRDRLDIDDGRTVLFRTELDSTV